MQTGNWRVVTIANNPAEFPKGQQAEIAFIGRSNVGKSSFINALVKQKNLARHSKTPGRTQQIFFFSSESMPIILVDLPGYGFARASYEKSNLWQETMAHYLTTRRQLRWVFLLIDVRHGFKPNDLAMLDFLEPIGVTVGLILTKCDKLPTSLVEKTQQQIQTAIATYPYCYHAVFAVSQKNPKTFEPIRKLLSQL